MLSVRDVVRADVPGWCRGAFLALVVLATGRLLLPAGPGAQAVYLVVMTAASALAWGSVVRGWRAGRWTAAGVTLSAVGDWTWQVLDWSGAQTDASVADLAYLASYVAVGMGLRRVLAGTSDAPRFDGLVDTAAVFLLVVYLEWTLVLGGALEDGSVAPLARVVAAAYPVLDAWLLALVVRMWFVRFSLRAEAGFVAAGAATWFVADLGYAVVVDTSAVLDVGWMLGTLALAASLWVAGASRPVTTPRARKALPVSAAQLVVTLLPLTLPGIVELVAWSHGTDVDPLPGMVVTGTMVVLAFGRAARLSRQQASLRTTLELRARRSATLAVDSADAVVVVDRAGSPMSGVGLPGSSAVWASLGDVSPSARRELLDRAGEEPGRPQTAELPGADGSWIEVRVVDRTSEPDIRGFVVTLQDVTERRRVQDELAFRAFHDELTGLANRALFDDRVAHALRRGARSGQDAAVLSLDLDGFKAVNDALGHPAGDELLRQVATRLVDGLRPADTVARLGGDEFAVLLEPQGDHEHGGHLAVAERLRAALVEPYTIGGRAVRVGVSIGLMTVAPDGFQTPTTLLRDADTALYAAKAAGKGQVIVFDPAMRAELLLRTRLSDDLPGALDRGELRVVYQPVVDLGTEQLEGFEALVRWAHPVLGEVAPDVFVPVAEETGQIERIGRWVLQEACGAAASWRTGPRSTGPTIAVNLSVGQLRSARLVADVAAALHASGLPPASLCLELTETALVGDTDQAADVLQRLRGLGVRLAVDDFGTGYSSITHLRRFPIDVLKIDRSFVSGVVPDQPAPPIVQGLLGLAAVMALEVVAEGVETVHQRDHLRAHGCRYAQGWLYSAALERAAADQYVADSRERAAEACPVGAGQPA